MAPVGQSKKEIKVQRSNRMKAFWDKKRGFKATEEFNEKNDSTDGFKGTHSNEEHETKEKGSPGKKKNKKTNSQ